MSNLFENVRKLIKGFIGSFAKHRKYKIIGTFILSKEENLSKFIVMKVERREKLKARRQLTSNYPI